MFNLSPTFLQNVFKLSIAVFQQSSLGILRALIIPSELKMLCPVCIVYLILIAHQNGLWGAWVTTGAGTAPGVMSPRGSDRSWCRPRDTTSPGGATTPRSSTWTTSPGWWRRGSGLTENVPSSGLVFTLMAMQCQALTLRVARKWTLSLSLTIFC